MIETIQIIGGLALLFFGGNYLVDGSVALARRMHISKAIIGLTIVALGTSAPEFVINIQAVIDGYYDIAIGNILGSNISNTFLILGSSGLVAAIALEDKYIRRDIYFLTLVTIAFLGFAYQEHKVSIFAGIVLLALLTIYSVQKYKIVKKNKKLQELDVEHDMQAFKACVYIFAGITLLILGGHFAVVGATGFAKLLGISEAVISLTIIALGSSAPELAACVAACRKGHDEIAITNVAGSNIFNIIIGLGALSIFKEIPISDKFFQFDLAFLSLSIFVILFATLFHKKIGRFLAVSFLLIYIIFVTLQYINI